MKQEIIINSRIDSMQALKITLLLFPQHFGSRIEEYVSVDSDDGDIAI